MNDPRQIYLETQVSTATPQKLQLMLIEGGIRKAQQAMEFANQGQIDASAAAFARCREILMALLSAIRDDGTTVTRNVTAIYTFLHTVLAEIELTGDMSRMSEVVQVLQEERITWQELCQLMPEAPVPAQGFSMEDGEILAPKRVDAGNFNTGYFAPHVGMPTMPAASSGFSLEI
jgi:flagellar protein FliS